MSTLVEPDFQVLFNLAVTTEMNGYKLIKVLVLIISIAMVILAVKRAVLLLADPPIVDETELKDVSEIPPPLITVCPTKQELVEVLKKNGYLTKLTLLAGSRMNDPSNLSWNGKNNKTFHQLIDEVYDKRFVNSIKMALGAVADVEVSGKKVYIPRYGLCKEYANYNTSQGLRIAVGKIVPTVHIFFTDSVTRNHFSPDFSSQIGQIVTGFLCN